ncbi:MAG: baseplate J/gp47 family protein [Bacteroidales bacterium]|nr:baseplate J/gp47 family protein [Bacteroidales bacterium]
MTLKCKEKHPLQYDGTSQDQRFLKALEPSNVPIHEFGLRDWMKFSYHFAAHLKFFKLSDDANADGNWQVFMKAEDEIEQFLKDAMLVEDEVWIPGDEKERIKKREPQSNYQPHLALFLSFLKLMNYPKGHLNGFTKRHLDFYYGEVLKLSKQPAVPDRVHILFELAKNATRETVGVSSLLDAGKDDNGKPLRYSTSDEIIVNTATVAMIKSVFHEEGSTIRYAEMTDSQDGLGTEFQDDHPNWQAFGDEAWPSAKLGFALASGVLLLKEGTRSVTARLKLKFTDAENLPDNDALTKQLNIFLTGEKDWVQVTDSRATLKVSGLTGKLQLEFTIDESEAAIISYNSETHGERYTTNLPVMRVLVNTEDADGYHVYSALGKATVTSAAINVNVSGAKDIAIENDQGKLDPSKPFYPFGTVPKQGSAFYMGSTEIFQKNWDNIKLNISWKNKPDDLASHYLAYREEFFNGETNAYNLTNSELTGTPIVDSGDHFKVFPQYISNNRWFPDNLTGSKLNLFDSPLEIDIDGADPGSTVQPAVPPLLLRKGIDINKAVLQNYLDPPTIKGSVKKPAISSRFEASKFDPGFKKLSTAAETFSPAIKSGFVKFTLQNSFMTENYARLITLYMIAKSKEGASDDLLIPNEPYIPEIDSITVDYSAGETNSFVFDASAGPKVRFDNFAARKVQLFHELPFGQSEQHVFLKEQCDFIDPTEKRNISLIPGFSPEGEVYIGLKNASASSNVSLLIQAVEGSEDPLSPTFIDDARVQWHALSNNEWKSLNRDYIIGDSTNNLLRPGIVKISLPASVNESSTILDAGYIWLKATLPNGLKHSSVCKLAGVHAQGIEAVFSNNGNELSHLDSSLPAGTIGKFVERPSLIKGLSQPYASFNGAPEEDDQGFYQRVSERLRHKQRAVNIWDYERLVLQKFPSIYKVKCLSHTSTYKEDGSADYFELSPGYVTLIVIPDIRNQNIFNPLQPRASQNLLREIEEFIDPLNSLHVSLDADNPDYETILLDFKVKFHEQYDANAYRNILNEDIIRHLSPWAFGEYSDIHFGGSLHKSVIIRYIEELPYVDFLSQFKMYHRKGQGDANVKDLNAINATNARAILVSAEKHNISLIEKDKVCNE